MKSLYTKQPLNKGHLCITAKTFFPKGVRYRGVPLYKPLIVQMTMSRNLHLYTPTQINYGRLPNTLGQQRVQFTVTSHTSTLHPIVCLPSSGDIVLVEMLTGKMIKKLQGHFGSVNCVASHPFEQVCNVRY